MHNPAAGSYAYSPHAANPDDRSEPSGEGVSAQGGACIHRCHDLDTLQPHPLQVAVIETSICQHLHGQQQETDGMHVISPLGLVIAFQWHVAHRK